MHLNLKHSGFDRCIVEHLLDLHCANIAEANITDESFSHEGLHSLPCLLVGDTSVENHPRFSSIHARIVVDPFRRISRLDWDERLRNREMNQVQVKVINSKISHRLLTGKFDMFWTMEGVPELRHYKKIFPRADVFFDSSFDTLSCLLLISVVTCGIEQPVSILDSVVYNIGARLLWHLPKSKTERR